MAIASTELENVSGSPSPNVNRKKRDDGARPAWFSAAQFSLQQKPFTAISRDAKRESGTTSESDVASSVHSTQNKRTKLCHTNTEARVLPRIVPASSIFLPRPLPQRSCEGTHLPRKRVAEAIERKTKRKHYKRNHGDSTRDSLGWVSAKGALFMRPRTVYFG